MDPIVAEVLDAVGREDRAALIRLLHPYLHWTEGGVTVRGRTKVLARLAGVPGPPASYELRDGQIYRWVSAQDG
ncbi:nuclear transport factor 2 family protein [Actinoplanes sp. NPDC048796]|uniref:nuclear transport factor 2 family protein n=1 Tax=unclassified Actinoplanes TaxID=2626549 RepID=UPI0033C5FADF